MLTPLSSVLYKRCLAQLQLKKSKLEEGTSGASVALPPIPSFNSSTYHSMQPNVYAVYSPSPFTDPQHHSGDPTNNVYPPVDNSQFNQYYNNGNNTAPYPTDPTQVTVIPYSQTFTQVDLNQGSNSPQQQTYQQQDKVEHYKRQTTDQQE